MAGQAASMPNIEAVRGYWDRRPCDIRHSGAEVGTREYSNEVEARNDDGEPYPRQDYVRQPWIEAMPPAMFRVMFRVMEAGHGGHTLVRCVLP